MFASTDAHWVSAGHPRTWPTEEQALAHAAPFEEFVQRGFAGGAGGSRSLIVGDTPPPFDVAAASPIRRSKRSAEASAVTDVGHSVRVPTRVKQLDFWLPHVRPLGIVAPCAEGGVHVHLRLFTGRTDTQLAVHQVHPAPTTPRPASRHATPRPTAPRHIPPRRAMPHLAPPAHQVRLERWKQSQTRWVERHFCFSPVQPRPVRMQRACSAEASHLK